MKLELLIRMLEAVDARVEGANEDKEPEWLLLAYEPMHIDYGRRTKRHGTRPGHSYDLHELEDGRIMLVWDGMITDRRIIIPAPETEED